ncbi:hypothetical protein [Leucobacter iarius]|uniref:Secreted protein n=1 Tax=Leucobacter iarius TaxID=333963 RepID=A0ABP4Y0W0_9MICO
METMNLKRGLFASALAVALTLTVSTGMVLTETATPAHADQRITPPAAGGGTTMIAVGKGSSGCVADQKRITSYWKKNGRSIVWYKACAKGGDGNWFAWGIMN